MMIKILFILLLPTLSYSFINIESIRNQQTNGFKGSFKTLFTQQTGNTDKSSSTISSLNSYKKSDHEWLFLAGLAYGESLGRKDTNNGSTHFRYTYYFKPTVGHENYIQFQYNEFTSLNFREVYGQGLRFILSTEKKYTLATGAGAFFEHEELKNQANQDAVRGNLYLSLAQALTETLDVSIIAYYQPSLKRSNDVRTIISAGSSLDITKSITFNFEYSYSNDNKPPIGVNEEDSMTQFGLAVKY